jgi:hypothetical protein
MTITLKTIGAAPSGETVIIEAKKLADFFQGEISGYQATELQASCVTQEFVDKHGIKARYASGTFMGFKASEEAEEEFETFKKK